MARIGDLENGEIALVRLETPDHPARNGHYTDSAPSRNKQLNYSTVVTSVFSTVLVSFIFREQRNVLIKGVRLLRLAKVGTQG